MKSSDCIPREKTLRLPKEFSEKILWKSVTTCSDKFCASCKPSCSCRSWLFRSRYLLEEVCPEDVSGGPTFLIASLSSRKLDKISFSLSIGLNFNLPTSWSDSSKDLVQSTNSPQQIRTLFHLPPRWSWDFCRISCETPGYCGKDLVSFTPAAQLT